jgi:hypothetical protein
MAYDPCGNLVLITDSTGNPVASYAYDRGTRGVTDVYNPNDIENLITTQGKRGVFTVPGFGDDWITLPIQRPGQLGTIAGGIAVDVTATGTGLSEQGMDIHKNLKTVTVFVGLLLKML